VETETEGEGLLQRKRRGTSIEDGERVREVKHCRVVVEIWSHCSCLGGLSETGHSGSC